MKMRTISIIAVVVLFGLLVGPAGAKRDDLYERYEMLTTVVDKIMENYVTDVDRQKLFYGAYDGMLQTLDPYSQFLPPTNKEDLEIDTKGEFGGVGIEITLDEHKVLSVITPLEGTPAFKAGVQAGDKIWKIEGKNTEGMTLLDAVQKLRGRKGTSVTITVTHETEPRKPVDIAIVRDIIKIKSIVDSRMVDDKAKIAYVRMTQFQEKTAGELEETLQSLKAQGMHGLILDLRFNPGGLLKSAVDVCDLFINSGVIVSTKGRNDVTREVYSAHEKPGLETYPMAVLVSGQSASASEIVAGAMQDHKRAVIVGSRSFGKGSVQTVIPLENGKSAMRLTTAYYYTPSGRLIHRKPDATEKDDWGIYPDIEIKTPPKEIVKLWKEWRDRHLRENRPEGAPPNEPGGEPKPDEGAAKPEVKENGNDEIGADEIDAGYDAAGNAPPAAKEAEEPFVDKPLEAAKIFIRGQLFMSEKAAAK